MKKVLVSFITIFTLVISCFSNAYLVKAGECPYTYDGNHDWMVEEGGYFSDQGWTEYAGFDCSKVRYLKRTCYYCFQTEWKSVPPSQHQWGEWEPCEKPEYYKKGSKIKYCKKCYAYIEKSTHRKEIPKRIMDASKAVTRYFKAAKKYNVSKMNKCFYKKWHIDKYPTNRKVAKIIRKRNKRKLKWKILSVSGSGAKYKFKCKVTVPDLGRAAYRAAYETHRYEEEYGYSKAKKIKRFVKYSKKNKNKTVKGYVKFTVLKTKKGWKIYKKTDNMMIAATGFYTDGDFWGTDDAPYHLWSNEKYRPNHIYKYVFGNNG